MKKTMIAVFAVFAVFAAVSTAKAHDIKVDFDGSSRGLSIEKTKLQEPAIDLPAVSKAVYDEDFSGELNHFKNNMRCISGNCEGGYPGEHCNIHTCGPSKSAGAEKAAPRLSVNKEAVSLGDLIRGLDAQQQQQFYGSLRFRDGALVDFYSKDIKSVYGKDGVGGIIRYFLPETARPEPSRGCRPNDPDCTEDSYIDNARCFSPHTCRDGYPGSTCTEAC